MHAKKQTWDTGGCETKRTAATFSLGKNLCALAIMIDALYGWGFVYMGVS